MSNKFGTIIALLINVFANTLIIYFFSLLSSVHVKQNSNLEALTMIKAYGSLICHNCRDAIKSFSGRDSYIEFRKCFK
jgi:hypothetical protein